MKLKNIILFASLLILTACGARTNSSNDLIVPVVQAVKNQNESKLQCMLPTQKQMKKGMTHNGGPFGGVFYNKYIDSYRLQTLQAQIHNGLEIIKDVTEINNLDWNNVQMGSTSKEDNNEANPGYSVMTTKLSFNGQPYNLIYHVIQVDNDWRLYNYISLFKQR